MYTKLAGTDGIVTDAGGEVATGISVERHGRNRCDRLRRPRHGLHDARDRCGNRRGTGRGGRDEHRRRLSGRVNDRTRQGAMSSARRQEPNRTRRRTP